MKNQIHSQEYKPNKYGWGTWNKWNNRKSSESDKPKTWSKFQAKKNS